ncbi:hypothetical protein TNCV_1667991 [Trichonephila clavipes]|nr:hypothetical protein TNCV_1667991 [Trichonephila clavipes]
MSSCRNLRGGEIIGMMEVRWSGRRVALQLACSDYVAQVATSLRAPVSSRTIRRRLAEGHLGLRCPLHALHFMPTY